jgi:hypothetical protein
MGDEHFRPFASCGPFADNTNLALPRGRRRIQLFSPSFSTSFLISITKSTFSNRRKFNQKRIPQLSIHRFFDLPRRVSLTRFGERWQSLINHPVSSLSTVKKTTLGTTCTVYRWIMVTSLPHRLSSILSILHVQHKPLNFPMITFAGQPMLSRKAPLTVPRNYTHHGQLPISTSDLTTVVPWFSLGSSLGSILLACP